MIYLATPYSHPDAEVRKFRYRQAQWVLYKFLSRRMWAYSPIVHCHDLSSQYALPFDAAYWRDYNYDMLKRCSQVTLVQLPGWQESVGMKEEKEMAQKAGIPWYYYDILEGLPNE